jgi:hypothetical protein
MDLRQLRLAFEVALDRCGDKVSGGQRLSGQMRRKLGREALWAAARAYDLGQAEQAPVDELVAFAFDCWPEVNRLPLYRTLQLRKRIGPRAMPYLEPFMVSAFAHKAHGWLRRRSWKYRGI